MIAEPLIGTAVTVTQEDIDQGCIGAANACPVARALRRALGRNVLVYGARVDVYGQYDYDNPPRHRFFLPGHVTSWIVRFDHGEPVSPFSFEIGAEL